MSRSNMWRMSTDGPDERTIIRMMVIIFSLYLAILIVDNLTIKVIPNFIHYLWYFVMFALIVSTSQGFYRISRISQFLIPLVTAITIASVLVIDLVATGVLSIDDWETSTLRAILNVPLIGLMILWLWFIYRILQHRILQVVLVGLSAILFPVILVGQFMADAQSLAFSLGMVYTTAWVVFGLFQAPSFYPSVRIRYRKWVLSLGFIALAIPALLREFASLDTIWTVLGFDLWIYSLWVIMFIGSDLWISTPELTIQAVDTYYKARLSEVEECVVLMNVDVYLKNIPEELIFEVDNDALTNTWIGLQRSE